MDKNIIDLTNKKIGRWTVLQYTRSLNRDSKWLCECECGTIKETSGHCLRRGESQSCGCLQIESAKKFKDLTGYVFGKLKVIERNFERQQENKNKKYVYWICECACGNIKTIRGDGLKYTKSCGCIAKSLNGLSTNKKEYRKYRNADPVIRLRYNISRLINKSLKGKKNGLSIFNYLPYTLEDLRKHLESKFEPWMNWNNYGGRMSDPRKTWHLDHIIPQTSFVFESMEKESFLKCWDLDNLRPLEKHANVSKGNRCNSHS